MEKKEDDDGEIVWVDSQPESLGHGEEEPVAWSKRHPDPVYQDVECPSCGEQWEEIKTSALNRRSRLPSSPFVCD